jgi:chemotaxis protein histidine kinase CheA
MQLDKDQDALSPESAESAQDEDKDKHTSTDEAETDKRTEWLLEQDMSDPEENLFTVESDDDLNITLSIYEAEMAGRPMFRGHGQGGDLSSMLEEEIVATDVGCESDIYASSNTAHTMPVRPDAPLAVDHFNARKRASSALATSVADGTDILGLIDDDDIGEHNVVFVTPPHELKVEPAAEYAPSSITEPALASTLEVSPEIVNVSDFEPDSELEFEQALDLVQDFHDYPDLDFSGFEIDDDLEAELDLSTVSKPDGMLNIAPEMELEEELKLDIERELRAEQELIQQGGSSQPIESVLQYISQVPAPSDDDEFDSYLLGGQELDGANAELNTFEVERTDGMASVDPDVDGSIDYHEDFHNIDGFNENAVSVFTGVIAQVMEEVTVAVQQRLHTLQIESEKIQVEAMLGNDVASIIECVNDGFAPIVDVRPDLPAALRQLGQTQVDAIYLRISHSDIPGNWNNLFDSNFVAPGSEGEPTLKEVPEDTAPQPFEAFDLDECDFEEQEESLGDVFSARDFDEDITPYAEESGEDPLASIDFSSLVEGDKDSHSADYESLAGTSERSGDEPSSIAPREEELGAGEINAAETDLSWCLPEGISFSHSNGGSAELFVEFLDVFFEEAATEIERLEDSISVWEAGEDDAVPDSVSRTLHTLKGISKGVGLHCFGTLIHNYETLLDGLSLRSSDQSRFGYFRIVNAWLDAVVKGFESIQASRTDINSELPVTAVGSEETEQNQQRVELEVVPASQFGSKPAKTEKTVSKSLMASALKPPFMLESDKRLADEGAQTLGAQQSIRMTSEALDSLLNLTNQAQQLGVRSSENTVRSKLAAAESLACLSAVKAHIVKIADRALSNVSSKGSLRGSTLDALEMDQYSELQEAANILRESVEDLDDLIRISSRHISMAEALMKQQSGVISSLGSSIQAVRVVPVARLFPGLRRIVRTVGADLGKNVSFKVLKQVGTLDRDNHARCQIILEHMVRNAMDHGIELPQQRLAQGKPAVGTITIDVNKKGADYIITMEDDGKGVDPVLMRETAYQRGLDVDVDALTDEEAVRLIFHKGFSTAATVSEISGRGVGLDIVLSELQQIGGDVEIESIVGEGTKFHIRIPPNVSVNGALLVAAGERSYAIPLDGLIAVDYVHVDDFFDAVANGKTLSLFGVECEPAYLATLCHGENLPERSAWPNSVPVLIAGSQDRYMAIAVDGVKQALELVIRSLGVQFSGVPGVAGATTTADGQAVVALDLNALVKAAGLGEMTPLSVEQEVTKRLLVLVVDDSRTQRMVSTSQFDTLGVETITAENGMVAIDLLNTTQRLPDVILLDVEMPVKDGIQTLREIRKSARYSNIPVIMVTSRTGAKHRALADEAGCDGYMGKPFNFPVLVEQINQLTGHKLQVV